MPKEIIFALLVIITLIFIFVAGFRIYWHIKSATDLRNHLDDNLKKTRGKKETILFIENSDSTKRHIVTNEMDENQPIMLASVTKLYTHSVIYSMVKEGLIELQKPISFYLEKSQWQGINTISDIDYSDKITVRMLLDQNSGIADYETDFKKDESIIDKVKREDFSLSESQAIELTKKLEGRFKPGENKAYYSNLNAILLGLIAEKVSGKSLVDLYEKYIFQPLKLSNTMVISKENSVIPYLQDRKTSRTLYASSAVASGGLVSNVRELMIFLKAFHQGILFKKSYLSNSDFNSIQFFPLKYGAGMMLVEMPFVLSPLLDAPQILGHSGLSGSFAFYCPSKDLYLVGSLNEYEANPYSWIFKYINAMK